MSKSKFNYLITEKLRHSVKGSDKFSFFRYPIRELQEYLDSPYKIDIIESLLYQDIGNPDSKIIKNSSEGAVDFANNTDLTNYIGVNFQVFVKPDYQIISDCSLFIGFFQKENNIPNLLIQYRWQLMGAVKNESWNSLAWDEFLKEYPTSGTPIINQVLSFPLIPTPEEANSSDILQVRVIRDNANSSGLFTGADPYTGVASLLNCNLRTTVK